LVFPKYRAVIQVQGCYWHGHGCAVGHLPADTEAYWGGKIASNRERDARNAAALSQLGWRQLTVWECALRGKSRLPIEAVLEACKRWLNEGALSMDLEGQAPNLSLSQPKTSS
jgi:DNA mismatch endonuclease (patch repair protein)